ncbi:MAG: hypothetical protein ACLPLP_28960 [Mycobacterium sp.]
MKGARRASICSSMSGDIGVDAVDPGRVSNFGIANVGYYNFGGRNTGYANFGLGNYGIRNIGIGVTGSYQIGIGQLSITY